MASEGGTGLREGVEEESGGRKRLQEDAMEAGINACRRLCYGKINLVKLLRIWY